MISIGHLRLGSPLVLAPLSGISDLPFRMVNRSFGCELAFTEMISAMSLLQRSRRTMRMLSTTADDRPLGIQILGRDPETIRRALDTLSDVACDVIDFNAACPVNKVVSSGEGAALLREPLKLERLLRVVVACTELPVTVKIRAGWDASSVNAVEVALRVRDAGVNGIFIHGRTRVQGYGGTVDYNVIRAVKESVGIPVIASGDALSPDLIRRLFDETGCDGVVVARGALGNPWIFPLTAGHLEGGTVFSGPDLYERARIMKEHLALNVAFYGEKKGVILFRKFFVWYAKGIAVGDLKSRAFHAGTWEEMAGLIDELRSLPVAGGGCRTMTR